MPRVRGRVKAPVAAVFMFMLPGCGPTSTTRPRTRPQATPSEAALYGSAYGSSAEHDVMDVGAAVLEGQRQAGSNHPTGKGAH